MYPIRSSMTCCKCAGNGRHAHAGFQRSEAADGLKDQEDEAENCKERLVSAQLAAVNRMFLNNLTSSMVWHACDSRKTRAVRRTAVREKASTAARNPPSVRRFDDGADDVYECHRH